MVHKLKSSNDRTLLYLPLLTSPNIFKSLTCVTYPDLSGGLMYTIFDVADRVTLLTCNYKKKFDTRIQVFHDTIEGNCVAENDDYCALQSRLEFDAVEKEHI